MAEPFVNALYEFAANSNRYTEYLKWNDSFILNITKEWSCENHWLA
jgi:hypothetical protein